MARSLCASKELQQASPASSGFSECDYGSRHGCGGFGEAGHDGGSPTVMVNLGDVVARLKGAKGGSFPSIGPTGESPNSTAVAKRLSRVRGDTTALVELRWLAAMVDTGLGRVLVQANYAVGLVGWQ